jgi:ergothioneine biosynthesis protein EgtB
MDIGRRYGPIFATSLSDSYRRTRATSERLCAPLAVEDYGVQPMDDASPPKWHLAHTTWFFETFLLKPFAAGYRPFDDRFEYLFNSYYNGVGNPYPRPRRGMLSRPTVAEIYRYRCHVDAAMGALLERAEGEVGARVVLGLHHEQQHQELLLTDVKYNLGSNPLLPAYRTDLRDRDEAQNPGAAAPCSFVEFPGGVVEIGAASPGTRERGERDAAAGYAAAFCFDNELPRHQVLLRPFALADRPVTNAEFLAFVEDGGYRRPELWLSDGWAAIGAAPHPRAAEGAPSAGGPPGPLYWYRQDGQWWEYRLSGPAPLDLEAPVTHVSYYDADAFARWTGHRLPTEQEWEHAAADHPVTGHFADRDALHPLPAPASSRPGLRQLFGDVWEWTASPYGPYPGYRPLPGTLGEYNGKFMSNQLVLRGGSCVTQPGHVRASYRNFFYPGDRWQFTGIRLAHDL